MPWMHLALVLAALLGASACGVPQEIYNTRVRELDRCNTELTRTQSDLASAQKSTDELATEASELRDRLITIESDQAKTARTRVDNPELYKNVATLAERRAELVEALKRKLDPLIAAKRIRLESGKSRVLIRMPESILFDLGRAELRAEGQALLHDLAAVLKQINRDFLVACHTDNQPLAKHGSPYTSAWELTLARSVAVVRHLQGEGVDPRRLGAAGYSEFQYLVENSDDSGRAINRRVELVVQPAPDELLPLPQTPDQRTMPRKSDR